MALDDTDTTTLVVTGSTNAAADIDTGAITGTDALTSVTATTSTAGATVTFDTIVDADSLTTLTLTGDYGNITLGNVGSSGSAENLATVNLTASNGATVTLGGTITADDVNSTTDLAMTVTSSAGTGSAVAMGTIRTPSAPLPRT